MTAIRANTQLEPSCNIRVYNGLEEEGCYYFNARWYDADTGRFITEDPIRDGQNWYTYVSNNPLRFTDPTGLYTDEKSMNSGDDYKHSQDESVGSDSKDNPGKSGNGGNKNGNDPNDPEKKNLSGNPDNPAEEAGTPKKSIFLRWKEANEKRLYKEKFDGLSDDVIQKLIDSGISANDLFGGVTGLVAKNPHLLASMNLAPELGKTFVQATSTASFGGIIIAVHNFSSSLESGDRGEIALNTAKLAIAVASYSNPEVGLGAFLLEKTYGSTMKSVANTAAQVNSSYNSNPVGFMSSLYSMFGGSPHLFK